MSDELNKPSRIDKELAFMLQFENIAWYDDGCVRILDRRVYPNKVHFVECKTHKEVSKAIADTASPKYSFDFSPASLVSNTLISLIKICCV